MSVDINCPACRGRNQTPDTHGHLNVNLLKNTWRCNRCGRSGGMLDLYILFSGTEMRRTEAWQRIEKGEPVQGAAQSPLLLPSVLPKAPAQAAPIQVRDLINREFLKRLRLAKVHREKLRQRGLCDMDIDTAEYRSVPLFGGERVVADMVKNGFIPKYVPGFYEGAAGWRFLELSSGILVPVRGMHGLIHGFQVRFDREGRSRYLTVSTGTKHNGAPAAGFIHIAGKVQRVMFVTEGVLKADVAHALSGYPFIGLLGTSNWGALKQTLTELKQQGLEVVVEAFDMDQNVNECVRKGAEKVRRIISDCGLECRKMVWNPENKGIDEHYYMKYKEAKKDGTWEYMYVQGEG